MKILAKKDNTFYLVEFTAEKGVESGRLLPVYQQMTESVVIK